MRHAALILALVGATLATACGERASEVSNEPAQQVATPGRLFVQVPGFKSLVYV